MKWKDLVAAVGKVAPVVAGVAGTVVGGPAGTALYALAQLVTGKKDADPDEIASTILGSPELRIKLEELAIEREKVIAELKKAQIEADNAALVAVNDSMQHEAGSEWWWQAAWRPLWGVLSALAFAGEVGAICWAMAVGRPDVLTAVNSSAQIWYVPLAILGVASWHRGMEKRVKAGEKSKFQE